MNRILPILLLAVCTAFPCVAQQKSTVTEPVRYEDGTIEWDYSTGGGFNDGRLQEYRENCRRDAKAKEARTAQLWHRQISLANAMLCFMI